MGKDGEGHGLGEIHVAGVTWEVVRVTWWVVMQNTCS